MNPDKKYLSFPVIALLAMTLFAGSLYILSSFKKSPTVLKRILTRQTPTPKPYNYEEHLQKDTVSFIKDQGDSNKLFTYVENTDNTIKIETSRHYDGYTALLYHSNKENLLRFLTYSRKKTGDNYYDEKYLHDSLTHEKKDVIETMPLTKVTQPYKIPTKKGIYYLEVKNEKNKSIGATYIVVNSKGLIVRQDDQKLITYIADLKTGQTDYSSTPLSFYSLENEPQTLIQTNVQGTGSFPIPYEKRVDAVVADYENETIFVPMKLPLTQADIEVTNDLSKTHKIFIYTDRPIYQVDDKVKFTGIVRIDNDGQYLLPPKGTEVKVFIDANDAADSVSTIVSTDEHGTISGEIKLNPKLEGTRFLNAVADYKNKPNYQTDGSTYFDIVHYDKPTFEIKTTVQKQEYLRNEQMIFTIKGQYFTTKPLDGQEVRYTIFQKEYFETERAAYNKNFNFNARGGMCGGGFGAFEEYYGEELDGGTIKLDKDGNATVRFTYPGQRPPISQIITLVATKKDEQNHDIFSASGTIMHASHVNIFFPPSPNQYSSGDKVSIPFYAEDLNGSREANKAFDITITEVTYGDQTTRKTRAKENVTTDNQGTGTINFDAKSDYSGRNVTITVETTDTDNNKVKAEKEVYVLPKDSNNTNDTNKTFLKIVSPKNSYKVGDQIDLDITAPEELDSLVTTERGRIYSTRIFHLVKGKNIFSIPVITDTSPSITVVFTFFKNGTYYTEGISLNVPAMHKLLQVQIVPDKQTYIPDETAHISVKVLSPDGSLARQTSVSVGIVDKAIFALRKNATPPIHSSLHYYRPRKTNASSSLLGINRYPSGGRGGGGAGGMNPYTKNVDTLYWNPNLMTNENGEVTIDVPLQNITTIWKIQAFASNNNTDVGQNDIEFSVKP